MRSYLSMLCGLTVLFSMSSCQRRQFEPVQIIPEEQFTLGKVQSTITQGMSQADVARMIGSPNIVTMDSEGREVWIYDKIASEANYARKGAGINLILIGAGQQKESQQSAQKTLTVIIKFDDQKQVSTFSYHASRF